MICSLPIPPIPFQDFFQCNQMAFPALDYKQSREESLSATAIDISMQLALPNREVIVLTFSAMKNPRFTVRDL
jgi:hypothetical protein